MKWIGQNIESFISRFRQKVFIESGDIEVSKVSGQPTLELSGWSATATAAHAGRVKFLKSGTATIDTYTAGNHTTAGEILGRIEAYGIDDGDGETLSSYIEFANDAISDADSSPGKIVFATSDADDAGTPTVRLTIDDDGLATFVGAISVGGNLTFDSVALTGIQTSAESFVDNDISIMTSAAIADKIEAYGYSTTAGDITGVVLTGDSGSVSDTAGSADFTIAGGTNCGTAAAVDGSGNNVVTVNVDDAFIKNNADDATTGSLTVTGAAGIIINDATTSSATEGGNLILASDDGAVMADNHRLGVIEFKGAEDTSNTLTTGARIQAIADATWSASENGASLEFYTTDGNASESVALTLDSDNLATFAGSVNIDSVAISAVQTGSESFVDNDTSIMTSAAIQDKILAYGYSTGDITGVTITTDDEEAVSDTAGSADFIVAGGEGIDTSSADATVTIAAELASDSNKGVASFVSDEFSVSSGVVSLKNTVGRVFGGTTVKILPNDFMPNTGGGATKGIQFNDSGTTGVKPTNASTLLWAFVNIPEGKKATHTTIYGAGSDNVDVFEFDVNADMDTGSGLTSLGTGSVGSTLDHTDFNSDATNYLAVRVTSNATGDRIFGGIVTIADQ